MQDSQTPVAGGSSQNREQTGVSPPSRQFSNTRPQNEDNDESQKYESDEADPSLETSRRTIHMFGLGSIGKLVAHSLRSVPNPPPVTLIAHRPGMLKEWNESKKAITVQQDGYYLDADGFELELAVPPKRVYGVELDDPNIIYENPEGLRPHEAAQAYKRDLEARRSSGDHDEAEDIRELLEGESDSPIYNLILSVKAPRTVSALSALKHRLRPESTVCILQNGMGALEAIKEHVFPDPATSPNFVLGIITHGANSPKGRGSFFAIHAGHGTIALCPQQREQSTPSDPSTSTIPPTTRYLMRTLTRVPVLAAFALSRAEFIQQQLEKLAQNAVINPLTVLADARNGSILYNFGYTRVMRLLLGEISLVIRQLPELRGLPNVNTRFSPERLETLVVAIANRTGDNVSSMLADVRNGVNTEIDFINGYIYKRGLEVGVQCVCNYMMMQMVVGKNSMIRKEMLDEIPMEAVDASTGERRGVVGGKSRGDEDEDETV